MCSHCQGTIIRQFLDLSILALHHVKLHLNQFRQYSLNLVHAKVSCFMSGTPVLCIVKCL